MLSAEECESAELAGWWLATVDSTRYARRRVAKQPRRDSLIPVNSEIEGLLCSKSFICDTGEET